LRDRGWSISDSALVSALNNYRDISAQTGRHQLLPASPGQGSLLVDCAHNIDGVSGLLKSISSPEIQLHIVFGTVGDKDPSPVLELIPANSIMYWCSADVPRSMPTARLSEFGTVAGLSGSCFTTVSDAISAARGATSDNPSMLAVVFGSVYIVGEALGSNPV
jgi:dihydrofolate synthase/folylpolyglutamate synthase